jgi:hypothetical protein
LNLESHGYLRPKLRQSRCRHLQVSRFVTRPSRRAHHDHRDHLPPPPTPLHLPPQHEQGALQPYLSTHRPLGELAAALTAPVRAHGAVRSKARGEGLCVAVAAVCLAFRVRSGTRVVHRGGHLSPYTRTRAHAHTHGHTRTHTDTHGHTRTHAHTRTHTRTHTHAHAHTPGHQGTPHAPHTRLHLQQGLYLPAQQGGDALLRPHSNTVAGASGECYTRPHPCQPSLELTEPHRSEANNGPTPIHCCLLYLFSYT